MDVNPGLLKPRKRIQNGLTIKYQHGLIRDDRLIFDRSGEHICASIQHLPYPFLLVTSPSSVTKAALIMGREPFRLGILGSGKGSNLVAIGDACADGRLPAKVVLVLADVPDAGILRRAQERGIRAEYLAPGKYRTKLDESAESAYAHALQQAGVEWVVLAGFMRVLKAPFLRVFPRRVLNIHPALLPSFPGLEAWKQALEYGVKVTGCTVHLVDEGIDTGPILAQHAVPILDDDTPETLHQRIQEQEHIAYVEALNTVFRGPLQWSGRRVMMGAREGEDRTQENQLTDEE